MIDCKFSLQNIKREVKKALRLQTFCIVFLLMLISQSIVAQVIVSGLVKNNKNKPVAGASITLKDTYDGATSDSLGKFSFSTSEKGKHQLETTISGYNSVMNDLELGTINIVLNIILKEKITDLNAVTITAGSFEASDKKKGTVLTSLDIVTTASANADITSALKTLPGTQQVGESEGLFVRGGTATESKIFIDGQLVNNFFYSSLPGIATRGRFNPFLFKGTIFSTGGYSALYGQALSSALILESTDLPDKTEASLNLSVIGLGGGVQKLSKDKKSSWGVTYNYTNLALAFAVIKQKQDFYKTPQYHTGDANFRIKTKRGMIKYYGYLSTNHTAFRNADFDSATLKNAFEIKNVNSYQNITWRENLANRWKFNAGLSFSTNRDDIHNELEDADNFKVSSPVNYASKNFGLINKAYYAQSRLVFEKGFKGLNALRFGVDNFYSNELATYSMYNGQKYSNRVKDNITAAFAETDIYVSKNLAAKVGARGEHTDLLQRWNVAPRFSLAYKFPDNSQASFAYGIFYQNPERKYLPTTNNNLGFSEATHYIFQYQKFKNGRILRGEVFYKDYTHLYKTGNSGVLTAINNHGKGYAKGAELYWRDKTTIKNFDYWFSYSYLDTKRDYLNFPGSITPNFAAKHTASLIAKKFYLPWKTGFNASYTFASGRPYYNFVYNNSTNKTEVQDFGKTINYNSLGFSLNYLPNLGNTKAKVFSVVVLSVTNVLGQNQVYGYNYGAISNNKVAIIPPSRRFVFIGWFLSFGVDRTQDAINNNL